jgi:hypothetical protein
VVVDSVKLTAVYIHVQGDVNDTSFVIWVTSTKEDPEIARALPLLKARRLRALEKESPHFGVSERG